MFHHRHIDQYRRAKSAEHRQVTREQLIELLKEDGKSEREIDQTLSIMEALGSEVMIGDVMYGIVEDNPLEGGSLPSREQE